MKNIRYGAISAILLASIGQVSAADLHGGASMKDDVVYSAPFNWSGLYLGVQAGYQWGDSDIDHVYPGFAPATSETELDGFVGGVHVGYNVQRSRIVFGVEADIEYVDSDDESLTTVYFHPNTLEVNYQASIRGRLGVASGKTLYYATAGVAFADFDYDYDDPIAAYDASGSKTFVGYTVGAGIEHAFSSNITARFEYRFTDFGDENFEPNNAALGTYNVELDEVHAVRVGVSYKFGDRHEAMK